MFEKLDKIKNVLQQSWCDCEEKKHWLVAVTMIWWNNVEQIFECLTWII